VLEVKSKSSFEVASVYEDYNPVVIDYSNVQPLKYEPEPTD